MKRWLARLAGDPFDLDELPYWFPSGPVSSVQRPDGFYLTGDALDALEDEHAVHVAALQALDEFSAIVALMSPGFVRPTIDAIFREDENGRMTFVQLGGTARGRSKVRAELSMVGAQKPTLTSAQRLLRGAKTDDRLAILIVLWADPVRTWPRLYRTLEEVERYLGQTVEDAGLTSGGQRKRFTRSANTAEIAGNDSRHALGKYAPPPNPMSLSDGTAFVADIIQQIFSRAATDQ